MSYYGWKPYVPVAVRRQKAEKAAAKARQGGRAMAPVPASRGAMAKTFWGKAWCDNLEHYSDFANRLPRGRTYLRNGSVIDLQVTPGEVRALVVGSSLYTVKIDVAAVPAAQWRAIGTQCSSGIASLVELLQGRLSDGVMRCICQPGTGLFPTPREITLSCSCPDWADMCKHVAAVLYGVGARLDQQPELLFQLRSVDAQALVAQASAGLRPKGKAVASAKVLDEAELGDVFGIEMEGSGPAVPAAPAKRKTAVKAQLKARTATPKKAVAKKAAAKKAVSKKAAAKTVVPAAKTTAVAKRGAAVQRGSREAAATPVVVKRRLPSKSK